MTQPSRKVTEIIFLGGSNNSHTEEIYMNENIEFIKFAHIEKMLI